MSTLDSFLVVIDPTQDEQPALEKAIYAYRNHVSTPKLHLFLGIDGQATDTSAKNPKMYRRGDWYKELVGRLEEEGIQFTVEISWSPDWSKSIIHSAKGVNANLILFPDTLGEGHHRFKLTDTKWDLLRHADCPVLIARANNVDAKQVILAAVKMQSSNEEYVELNKELLRQAKWIAELTGREFHVVNAYSDSMHYPDRAKILREVNIPAEHIHIKQGPPDEIVASVAKEIGAQMVVIGTLKRTGLLAAMRGNTSELVMSKVECDIMTLN